MEFAAGLPTAQYVGSGWLFVLVKVALAMAIVALFADYVRDEPTRGFLALAAVAGEAGVPVSFDPGRRLPDRDFPETLRRADVVFVNDQEAETLLAEEHDALADDRVVVVKHGEEGAAVHAPEGRFAHPGFEVDPVDTTGAGDAFAAGFIATRLADGGFERALEFANACGALAAREEGARTAPSRETVEGFLDEQFPA